MGKDFAIIPTNNFKIDIASKIIESEMKINKIRISKKNCIVIGENKNIVFDISTDFIKGKILEFNGDDELSIVKSILKKMSSNDVYLHFYGQENFFKTKDIKEV